MSFAEGLVAIRVRLFGAKEVTAETDAMNASIAGTGAAAEASAVATAASGTRIGGVVSKLRGSWTTIVKIAKYAALGLAGATAAVVLWGKRSLEKTEGLAKQTMTLQKNIGGSAKQVSGWLSLIQAWGGDMTSAGMAMKTFSSNVLSASEGSKSASKAFHRLGFSGEDIKKAMKDPTAGLLQVSEGMEKMPQGAARYATASKLFGKGFKTILPILSQGTDKVKEQLHWARQYGAVLSGNTVEALHELKENTVKANLAMEGLEIMFAQKIIPVVIEVITWFNGLILEFRHGKGPIEEVVEAVEPFVVALIEIVKWVIESEAAINTVIGLYVAWKFAAEAVTIAQELFNIALLECPVFWVIAAIILLAFAFYLAYHKVKWFHDAVDKITQAFGGWANMVAYFIFTISPLGALIALLVGHFNWLKNAGTNAFNWIKGAAEDLYDFFNTTPVGETLGAPFKLIAEIVKWCIGKVEDFIELVKEAVSFAEEVGGFLGLGGGGHVKNPEPWHPGVVPGSHTTPNPNPIPPVGEAFQHPSHKPQSFRKVKPTGNLPVSFTGGGPLRTMQPVALYVNGRKLAETVAEAQEDERARA